MQNFKKENSKLVLKGIGMLSTMIRKIISDYSMP